LAHTMGIEGGLGWTRKSNPIKSPFSQKEDLKREIRRRQKRAKPREEDGSAKEQKERYRGGRGKYGGDHGGPKKRNKLGDIKRNCNYARWKPG